MKHRSLNVFEETNKSLWEERTADEEQIVLNEERFRRGFINKLAQNRSAEDEKVIKAFEWHEISKIDTAALLSLSKKSCCEYLLEYLGYIKNISLLSQFITSKVCNFL